MPSHRRTHPTSIDRGKLRQYVTMLYVCDKKERKKLKEKAKE